MLDSTLVPPQALLFSSFRQGWFVSVCITQTQARLALSDMCNQIGLSYSSLGFHGFRRSGVSFLYANNIPLSNLQTHGTWTSEAVYSYLTPKLPTSFLGPLPSFFDKNNFFLPFSLPLLGLGCDYWLIVQQKCIEKYEYDEKYHK